MDMPHDYTVNLKPEVDAEAFEEAGRLAARLFLTAYASTILDALGEADDDFEGHYGSDT